MPKRLSYQLYSSRNFGPIEATLAMLAKAGYREVEGYGGIYDDPKTLRAKLDALGLTMPTGHFGLDMLEGSPKAALVIARTLGMRSIYAPYIMPEERPKSAAAWKAFGKRLALLNSWARSEGYSFGWHNHDFEFVRLKDGSMPHERIFDAAPTLDWECDVAWVAFAKQNPVKWIKAYGSAITAVHIKDNAPKGENLDQHGQCDVGQGTVKWPEILAALKDTRVMSYIMEHDEPKDDASFAKRSFDFVSKQ